MEMLHLKRLLPGDLMGNDPCRYHKDKPSKSQPYAEGVQVVLTENDVVHIAHETGKHDQSDVYNDKSLRIRPLPGKSRESEGVTNGRVVRVAGLARLTTITPLVEAL
jgi:hypothetical protein